MIAILGRVLLATLIVAVSFTVSLWTMDYFWPRQAAAPARLPSLAELPPLPPATRASVIIAPVAITLPAIREAMEANAPRDLSGKQDNPLSKLLSKADIGFTVARTPIAVSGRPEALTISTGINGALRVTGQLATGAANLGGTITSLLNQNLGRDVQNVTGKVLDQRADIRGQVAVSSRPAIGANWRIEPNLTGQVTLGEGSLSIAGARLSVSREVKPLIDRAVNEQITALQNRLRGDPFIEQAARREWAKMCRAIPLGGGKTGMPDLWLEMRPTRAFAAQPRIDANAVTLTVGVQADTRIVPNASTPHCPFPAQLELVPPLDQGRVNIGVPVDVPFTEINKLLETQMKDRKFPEDGSGPAEVTVRRANMSASGERLLISLLVNAKEKKSWFGFGTEATIHIWGKPTLDREQQILRMTDLSLAVESEAAFGLLGAAAQAALPYLQSALEKNAVVDLKPFAASARTSIERAIADFRQQSNNVKVDAAVTGLRLVGIEFDSRTLRIVAEADGNVRVAVSKLP
ncbi:MAG: DUF4403 family protein [Pseudorhodoplanes sp.]|nr:DUF4403 family protein [Pseudorhodoplanes sp.]MCL4712657.1 DUF4403 family protein [Pseudorhodoplanes sp.]MCQ3941706.1 hypothetical protein [Alphaproteobacteria bacterium]GIK81455.1 MAG: hypothetical protein BroJett024_25600 [Alphaproteobacteria bacterium]